MNNELSISSQILKMGIRKNYVRLYCLLILTLISLFSCNTPTSSHTTSFSGSVILSNDTGDPSLNPVDFAGVRVELYELEAIDPYLSEAINKFPSNEFILNQETEFDHVGKTPIYTTVTEGNGSFIVNEIIPGNYNVVLRKEGWGFVYYTDYQISESYKNSKVDFTSTLYPEIIIGSAITSDTSFLANHVYMFPDNTLLIDSKHLEIEYGATLVLKAGISLDIYGDLTLSGNENLYLRIICDEDQQKFDRVTLQQSSHVAGNELKNIILTRAQQGLFINKENIAIENLRGKDSVSSITISQVANVMLQNIVVSNCGSIDTGAIQLYGSADYMIQRSIFANNMLAIESRLSSGSVSNTCFLGNTKYDFKNSDQSVGVSIVNCEFVHSKISIWNTYQNTLSVSLCNFEAEHALIDDDGVYGSTAINNCNFNCSVYAVSAKYVSYYNSDIVYINATNNYWGSVDISVIEGQIWDMNKADPSDPYYNHYWGVVNYTPFRYSKVSNAGIQIRSQ